MAKTEKPNPLPSPSPAINPGIILVDGDKGGVGKSFACSALIDKFMADNMPVAAVEGDTQNPDVARMFEGAIPLRSCNLRDPDGWMDLLDFMMEERDKPVIVSMPAGIGARMKVEGLAFCDNMSLINRPIHLVWLLNRLPDSINLLSDALNILQPSLQSKTAIKNLYFGESRKFGRWDESHTKRDFETTGGKTFELQELNDRVVDKIFGDPQKTFPFSQCVTEVNSTDTSTHGLTPSENLALIQWIKNTHSMFAAVKTHMSGSHG